MTLQKIDKGRYLEATRPDGLKVFFDKGDSPEEKYLNHVRENAPSKIDVILAVASIRALQIAKNYAEKYAPELVSEIPEIPLIADR